MGVRGRPGRAAWVALCLCSIVLSAPPPAAHGGGRLGATEAAIDKLNARDVWPPGEARPLLDVLERETKRFLDLPAGKGAIRTGTELIRVLSKFHDGLSGRLGRMREEVFDRDGDIEALIATPSYRERQTLALTSLYHLSWARYQQALLLPAGATERKDLLRKAVRGFTEFVYVNEVPEVYGDCLYGRGLAFYALGQKSNATADLQAVVDLGRRTPSYSRARLALDAVRRGKPIRAPTVDRTQVELGHLKKTLAIAVAAPTANADGETARSKAQEEALLLARGLAARSEEMAERVVGILRDLGSDTNAFVRFVLGELASDRGNYAAAREHYAAARDGTGPDAAPYRARAISGMASASYAMGDYAQAAKDFGDLLGEDLDGEARETALYFRYKALEALRAGPPDTPEAEKPPSEQETEVGSEAATGESEDADLASDEATIAALQEYLDRFPEGNHTAELRYRLAELHQSRADCAAALDALDAPLGSESWSHWSRFVKVQCGAQVTRALWRDGSPEAEPVYATTLEAARTLIASAAKTEDAALRELGASASLVAAFLAATGPEPRREDVLALTDGFEQRFAGMGDLVEDVVALRAVALAGLGRINEARAEVERLIVLDESASGARRRQLGQRMLRTASEGDAAERASLLPLVQRLYLTLAGPDRNTDNGAPPTVDDLAVLGQVSLELGDVERASDAYERLIALDPDSIEGRRGAARSAEARGDRASARAHWFALLERTKPGEVLWLEATVNVARFDEELGRPDDACAVLERARAESPPPPTGELGQRFTELEARVCR